MLHSFSLNIFKFSDPVFYLKFFAQHLVERFHFRIRKFFSLGFYKNFSFRDQLSWFQIWGVNYITIIVKPVHFENRVILKHLRTEILSFTTCLKFSILILQH